MLIKILSMTFDSARGGFNDEELRDFIKDVEVVSIRDHLFIRNEVPYLTMIIKYFPLRTEIDPKMTPKGRRDEPWREMLTELMKIEGVGKAKADKYGEDILRISKISPPQTELSIEGRSE